jgi:hypothetical protein
MNEQLFFDIGQQKYTDDVTRGEANYQVQNAIAALSNGPRAKIAVGLVSLATRLQPNLAIEVQQPARPATA